MWLMRVAVACFLVAWLFTPLTAQAHTFAVDVDQAAKELAVRAEFSQRVRLELGASRAARYIRKLRRCDTDESLTLRRGQVQSLEQCVEYSVRLNNSANRSRVRERYAAVKDHVTGPDTWMLLPDDDQTLITVDFRLPEGVNVSVPWQPQGPVVANKSLFADVVRDSEATGYRLERYTFRNREISSKAVTAFGYFPKERIAVPGGELRLALLRTRHAPEAAKMRRWLSDAASNVSYAHGNFPMKSTQVVVVPVNERASEPVPFGHVIRNGGEAVQFFVDTDWNLDAFLGDWTATHEFSHLLMPYVQDRWVSEGFASYYQNVLMARGKAYTPEKAWRKLYEGYGRGRQSAPGMSPRSANMRNGGLMKMYWSGAALALIGDVQLRQRSNNTESLDTAMRKIRLCCLPSRRAYTDSEFFKLLDSKTSYTVFSQLHKDYANAAGFPDVATLFRQLGVVTGSRVRLVDAELADIRDAIMNPAVASASAANEVATP